MNTGNRSLAPKLTEDQTRAFLEFYSQEVHNKSEQLQLEKQQENNRFQFAMKALDAEAKDRESNRSIYIRSRRDIYIFAGIVAALSIGALLSLAALGKEALAMEIIKGIVFVGSGAISGYFYGKNKIKKD